MVQNIEPAPRQPWWHVGVEWLWNVLWGHAGRFFNPLWGGTGWLLGLLWGSARWLSGLLWGSARRFLSVLWRWLLNGVSMQAVYASAVALALTFLIVGIARALWDPLDSSVMITLILIPPLAYLIASGKLSEFKAPGGFEAKLAQTASATVRVTSETIVFDDPELIRKAHVRHPLALKTQEIDQTRPALLTMTVGKPRYDVDDLRQYLRVLTQFRNFKLVVFLDTDGRFVASMSPWSLKQLLGWPERHFLEHQAFEHPGLAPGALEEQALAEEFVTAVNEGQKARIRQYPGVCKKTASTTATNAETLQQMLEQNIDALAVIDTDGRVRGVVEREQLLVRMALALVR